MSKKKRMPYIRGASGVMNRTRKKNFSLAIDNERLLIISNTTITNLGHKNQHKK